MADIKALVVDDSRVVRTLVGRAITLEPGVTVVGEGRNGVEALERVRELEPDVLILDVEMPELNGLEVVQALRVSNPRLPIIMFSTLTERGAKVTVDALLAGASDYVLKPSSAESVDDAIKLVHDELVPKINVLCKRRPARSAMPERQPTTSATTPAPRPAKPVPAEVIVIGSSTGGPQVIELLLSRLPENSRVPVLIAQHMPPMFTTMLASRLDKATHVTVVEAENGQALRPGHVYIAPGDRHMELSRTPRGAFVRIHASAPQENNQPSASLLLESAARHFGIGTLAVVLTGMGKDGLRGAQAVHDAGGTVLVQDQASSAVWGMPGSIVRAGIADAQLSPESLAARLAKECA